MFKTTKAKVIFVFIFSVICILITLGLILYKNINIDENVEGNNSFESAENENKVKDVAGIDLQGTYNQNDLTIEEKKVTKEKAEIQYCQIYGLKDKLIQDNINNELRQIALNYYLEEIDDLDEVINVSVTMWNTANFGNTLSFETYYVAKKDDNGDGLYQGFKCLNYDLVTGEEITIDKMFTSDAPMKTILRRSAYYSLVKNSKLENNLSGDFVVSDYGDIEDEVAKFINLYNNDKINEFYFTPSEICIYYEENKIISVSMQDYAEYIAIYNRYLTEESIFEVTTVGFKNLFTLTDRDKDVWYYNNYQNENNYYIDITIGFFETEADENTKKFIQNKITNIEKEIEKTKAYASKYTDKFYILNYHIDISTNENLICYKERGNSYEMTLNDFEVSVEPVIREYYKENIETLPEYVYDFSQVLKIEPQQTIEYYDKTTGEKVVI